MGYRETAPPVELRALVETAWVSDGRAEGVRVLPDGCMDLIAMDGKVVVAGPDITALTTPADPKPLEGLRFRPGVLPRLLGLPAAELVGQRASLDALGIRTSHTRLPELTAELADRPARPETSPWSLRTLGHVTASLAAGAPVGRVADDVGWSARTLQRHCHAVYGYGPVTLRRVLRFRRAVSLLRSGLSAATVAAEAGYADKPHLHRDMRKFAGMTVTSLAEGYAKGANRSTDVPSGSRTVA